MFCKFCGKEIDEDVSYCQYCGGNLKNENKNSEGTNKESVITNFNLLIKKLNFAKFISIVSISFFVLSIIIRFALQEVITVRHFLAYDDYYVLSDSGRLWIIFFIIIQSIVMFACNYFAKKYNKVVKAKSNVFSLIFIIVEIIFLFLKIPALY